MALQILVNSIIAASVYALLGVSFVLVYRVCRFFHLAHGGVFAGGAYLMLLLRPLYASGGWATTAACFVLATCCAGVLGAILDGIVYRPLMTRNAPALVLLLASLGVYVLLQNTISLIFGDQTQSLGLPSMHESIVVFGAHVTPIQGVMILASVVSIVTVGFLLSVTRAGMAVRAIANDPELASVSGVRNEWIVALTFTASSAMAGAAGILAALDTDMTPTTGLQAIMMAVVAAVVGGLNSIWGVVLGALALGMAQHFGAWALGSEWKEAVAFVVLWVVLVTRPKGLLGKAATRPSG